MMKSCVYFTPDNNANDIHNNIGMSIFSPFANITDLNNCSQRDMVNKYSIFAECNYFDDQTACPVYKQEPYVLMLSEFKFKYEGSNNKSTNSVNNIVLLRSRDRFGFQVYIVALLKGFSGKVIVEELEIIHGSAFDLDPYLKAVEIYRYRALDLEYITVLPVSLRKQVPGFPPSTLKLANVFVDESTVYYDSDYNGSMKFSDAAKVENVISS